MAGRCPHLREDFCGHAEVAKLAKLSRATGTRLRKLTLISSTRPERVPPLGHGRASAREACEDAEASDAKRDHLQQGIIERGGDSDAGRRKEQRKIYARTSRALPSSIRCPPQFKIAA